MVARKSALIVANTVASGLLGAVAVKLSAQAFGKTVIGEVGFALGLVGLFHIVTDLGFHGAHIKRVSEGEDEGDCIATFAAVKLALTAFMILAVVGLIGFRVVVQNKAFFSTGILTLLLVAAYYAFRSVLFIGNMTFDATRTTIHTQAVNLTETALRVAATILGIAAFLTAAGRSLPLVPALPVPAGIGAWLAAHPSELLAATYAFGAMGATCVSGYLLLRHHPIGRFDGRLLKRYFTFALPIFMLSAIGLLSMYADRVTIGYFWGADEVGAYFGAQRITFLLEAVPAAVAVLLFPTLSALVADDDHDSVREVVRQSLRYITLLTLPLTVFVMVFAEETIAIFLTNDFKVAAGTLAYLSAAVFAYSLLRPYISVMSGADRPAAAARLGVLMGVTNLVVTVLLVPKDIKSLGITLPGLKDEGAAIGLFVSAALGLFVGRYEAHRLLAHDGVEAHPVAVWKYAAATVIMTLTFWVLKTQTGFEPRLFVLAGYGVAGFLVFVLALAALAEFTREDLAFFKDLAHPGRFFKEAFSRRRD